MARPDFDPATVAVVSESMPTVRPAPAIPDPIPVVRYAPNTVVVTATPSAPALLVLADNYYDGWSVIVDGKLAPIVRVNYTLRGVWLSAGSHTIEFVYRPLSFLIGGLISVMAMAIVAIVMIVQRGRG